MLRFASKTLVRGVLLGVAVATGTAAAGTVAQPNPLSHPEGQTQPVTSSITEHTLTNDHRSYIDCLISSQNNSDILHYCLRINDSMAMTNSNGECYTGDRVEYETLKDQNVVVSALLNWSIPLDVCDDYGAFLNGGQHRTTYICNCTEGNFGRYCEYSWNNQTIDEIIWSIAKEKSLIYPEDRSIPCYELLDGNDEKCLDYRDICDGEWDLKNGQDEIHCDLLETNECELNEFRCRNGFCIDRQFLLDGEADCLDLSDEQRHLFQEKYNNFLTCYERATIDCDEHWCNREEISCGDGQCFPWYKHFWYAPSDSCKNHQSDLYKCSIHQDNDLDTTNQFVLMRNDGRCTKNILDIQEDNSSCLRTIQCAVTHHSSCAQLGLLYSTTEEALPRVQQECQGRKQIEYAFGIKFLSPFVEAVYSFNQFNVSHSISFFALMVLKQPAFFCFIGIRQCDGVEVTHNGSICVQYDDIYERDYPYPPFDYLFCKLANTFPFSKHCRNGSPYFIRCLQTNECISKHRLFDGFADCLNSTDEKNYTELKTEILLSSTIDRYSCGSANVTTGMVMRHFLGDGISQCVDGTDEMSMTVNWQRLQCQKVDDGECSILRELYQFTSNLNEQSYILSFNSLCDSIWDLRAGVDEINCEEWICEHDWIKQNISSLNRNQWQGYCIDHRWVCNEVWDFPDGSDEYNCNYTKKYPIPECLVSSTQQQILSLSEENTIAGNGLVECSGGVDERNTHMCSDGFPLNDRFLCNDKFTCLEPRYLCDWEPHCPTQEDESIYWCGNRSMFTTNMCTIGKFSCLETNNSGPCVPNEVRCNFEEKPSCQRSFRDEFMCIKPRKHSYIIKESLALTNIIPTQQLLSNQAIHTSISPWYCDKGLPVFRYGQPTCFCPPSFLGSRCHIHDHRISVVFSIEDTDQQSPIRVAVLLRYQNETIDFKIITQMTKNNKNRIYLNYPWSFYSKLNRPSSNFNILFLYFTLGNGSEVPQLKSVWQYGIKQSFLPATRLAVILRNQINNCLYEQSSQCQHGKCHQAKNHKEIYYCECDYGWQGEYCDKNSLNCTCSPESKCISGDNQLCICAANRFGPTCHIPTNPCPSNFCQNQGVCITYMDEFLFVSHRCSCSEDYFGKYCEHKKAILKINLNNESFTYPSIIQQLNYEINKMELTIQRQHIMIGNTIIILHNNFLLPPVGLLKIHSKLIQQTELYLLYIGSNYSSHQIIEKGIRCSHAREYDLLPKDSSFESLLIKLKQYHSPCQKSNSTVCFYDERNYFCFCHEVTRRATCFQYNFTYDQCDRCMNEGRCFAGDQQRNKNDFVCHCPQCVYGALCQYRMNQISFSLESVLSLDLSDMKSKSTNMKLSLTLYIIVPVIMVTLGFVSNFLTFVTLCQRSIQVSIITRYIQFSAIANQLTLVTLLLQTTYVTLNIYDIPGDTQFNAFLCKTSSYSLLCFVYISKWFIGLLSIYRARATSQIRIATNSYSFKHIFVVVCILIIIFSFNSMEIFFHHLLVDLGNPRHQFICVVEYTTQIWKTLEVIFIFLNHVIPFLLNIYATYVIIQTAARSKATLNKSELRTEIWKQIKSHYEQLICPIIMIVCSTPQLLVGFLTRCYQWDSELRRKVIIIIYFVSFLPQTLTFCLFILPSKKYKNMFVKSNWAKLLPFITTEEKSTDELRSL